jgi:alpha-amylase
MLWNNFYGRITMQNKTLIQFFEWYCPADGQHWNRFAAEIQNLLSLGITAVWLPPAYKGTRGDQSEGYDVYDLYDLGEFDQKGCIRTKYGTKQEYTQAITAARQAGIEVYIDIVLNHMGGAEETEHIKVKQVDPENRLHFISPEMEIEAYTRFTFPGRNGKYSQFQWNYQCFTGIDHAVGENGNTIYNIINDCGDTWEPLIHNEKGNYDYLMLNDIETRNAAVRQELKNWIKWYHDTVAFDGVRLDAVKHINPCFFIEWLDHIRKEINPALFAIGEYWLSDDLPVLLKYIETTGERMSLFDAPLHHNFAEASRSKESYDLRNILHDTLTTVKPQLAVTFVDNHDTQPLQGLEEYTEQWFKPHAYALILLRDAGYPCVFFPDLYGTDYTGKNKKNEECKISIPPLECLPALLQLRIEYSYGNQLDYFDDPHCIGWTRQGMDDKPGSGLAVLLCNDPKNKMSKRMIIGKKFAGRKFRDYLQNSNAGVVIDENGVGEFLVEAASVSVWTCTEN